MFLSILQQPGSHRRLHIGGKGCRAGSCFCFYLLLHQIFSWRRSKGLGVSLCSLTQRSGTGGESRYWSRLLLHPPQNILPPHSERLHCQPAADSRLAGKQCSLWACVACCIQGPFWWWFHSSKPLSPSCQLPAEGKENNMLTVCAALWCNAFMLALGKSIPSVEQIY